MIEETAPPVNRVAPPLLQISGLDVTLGHGLATHHVLHGVSLTVHTGTALAIVGESGSGKSTIAKTIVGMHRPAGGRILFDGEDLNVARTRSRRTIQLIPQDPYSSLDPRRTIGQTLAEAVDPRAARLGRHRETLVAGLEAVSLDESALSRYPHQFSGGQRQRIAIARALVVDPRLIIADEITSALDVSTQAEVLALLRRLRADLGLTMVFITHNLAVVQQLCDEVAVLLHGDLVEQGSVDDVFSNPSSDYTRTLLASVPGAPGFTLERQPQP